MHIIFLGAPGAGKGTQAEVISERYSIPIIGTGNLIRAEIKSGSPLGEQIKEYSSSGKLVPDSIVVEMLKKRLAEPDAKNGYILDGFPRNVAQAQVLEQLGIPIDKVISIEVPDDEIVKRLSGRRTCAVCGVTYHIDYNPPTKDGICDREGGELVIREDDKIDVIKERLNIYHEETEPVAEYYRKQNKLRTVKSQQKVEDTTALTIAALES